MTSELKPCPFCGSNDLTISDTTGVSYDLQVTILDRWVTCEKCDAEGPPIEHDFNGTPEEATATVVRLWNTRTFVSESIEGLSFVAACTRAGGEVQGEW